MAFLRNLPPLSCGALLFLSLTDGSDDVSVAFRVLARDGEMQSLLHGYVARRLRVTTMRLESAELIVGAMWKARTGSRRILPDADWNSVRWCVESCNVSLLNYRPTGQEQGSRVREAIRIN